MKVMKLLFQIIVVIVVGIPMAAIAAMFVLPWLFCGLVVMLLEWAWGGLTAAMGRGFDFLLRYLSRAE